MVTRDKTRDDFAAPDTFLAGLSQTPKIKAETFGGADHVDD